MSDDPRDDNPLERQLAQALATAPTPADLARGLRFLHLCDASQKARISETHATLLALVETLIAEGVLPYDKLDERRRLTLVRENKRAEAEPGVAISGIEDKRKLEGLPEIDCAARLPLCKARCCQLPFVLSPQDLDEGVVAWDYGKPYRVRQRAGGYCVHNDDAGACSVYADRPAQCRLYDCREDRRIWLDFEARIPAP